MSIDIDIVIDDVTWGPAAAAAVVPGRDRSMAPLADGAQTTESIFGHMARVPVLNVLSRSGVVARVP